MHNCISILQWKHVFVDCIKKKFIRKIINLVIHKISLIYSFRDISWTFDYYSDCFDFNSFFCFIEFIVCILQQYRIYRLRYYRSQRSSYIYIYDSRSKYVFYSEKNNFYVRFNSFVVKRKQHIPLDIKPHYHIKCTISY